MRGMLEFIRPILSPTLGHTRRLFREPAYREFYLQACRLRGMPRYQQTRTRVLGYDLTLVDTASFLSNFRAIFVEQMYQFHSVTDRPVILDCGANIGLSVLYFKRLYPRAIVTAFEPDPRIFAVLQSNIAHSGYSDIKLEMAAVWWCRTEIEFAAEGADAGRIARSGDQWNRISVPTVRLRDHLNGPIDFLKLDIEGAETEVLSDCSDVIRNVKHIFVEYHSFERERQTLGRLLDTLAGAGFRVYIHSFNEAKQPFIGSRGDYGFDMQLNLFCLNTNPLAIGAC